MVVSTGAAVLSNFKMDIVFTELIKAQIFESLVMLGCGMVIALLHGLFTRHMKIYLRGRVIPALFEMAFWIFAGTLGCRFLFYSAYGELSIHVICAFICGVFLWNLLFYATMSVGDGKWLNKEKKEAESLKTQRK